MSAPKPKPTILNAMTEPTLFGKTFKPRLLRSDTWGAWRAFLAALFGLPVGGELDIALITKCAERSDIPSVGAFTEAYCICGRRGGKSIVAALIAAYLACLRDYSGVLAPGETGVIPILASDKKQSRVIFNYTLALIKGSSVLARMIVGQTKESIDLSNHVRIEMGVSSFKSVRGYTILACLADEIAFWEDDQGANPAAEVLNAVRPGMSSIPGAILLGLSSPYAKRGVLFEIYKKNFGKSGAPVLVWRADTRTMNPNISERTIAANRVRDPAAARSEWDAEFREDLESFATLQIVDACTIAKRFELAPAKGTTYGAFVDPSGGSSDSFTLAISHERDKVAVLDVLREVTAPFSPDAAVREFCAILKQYRISTVTGDAYAGEWPREKFSQYGITYEVSDKNRSELYLALLPLLMSGQCELLDNQRLKNQLVGLERRTGRQGKDSIDHIPGSHDDCANAAAGALVLHSVPWFVAMAEKHAEKTEQAPKESTDPDDLFRRRTEAGMREAANKDQHVAHVFGERVGPPPQVARSETKTVARTEVCPRCGLSPISRCGVTGPSGDIEERCGRCNWSQIVPRRRA